MKCQRVQKRLLAEMGEGPLPVALRRHVDDCDDCRLWVKRVSDIDAGVGELPVPDSQAARSLLIHRFLHETTSVERPWRVGPIRLNWVRVVSAVAAVVLVGIVIAGLFNREHVSKQDDLEADALLAQIVDRHVELAGAPSEARRIELLADLADDLDKGARSLAYVAKTDDLNSLAELYVSVVGGEKGIVARVDDLGNADKQKLLLGLANRLRKSGDGAERLSREVPPAAIDPMKRIAAAAKDAHQKLSRKAREENITQDAPTLSGAGRS